MFLHVVPHASIRCGLYSKIEPALVGHSVELDFAGCPGESMEFWLLSKQRIYKQYSLLVEAARLSDRSGLFHPFGGLFQIPPSLVLALAAVTERVQIRAGSLISPLHHTLRIVEDWSVVDNLSGRRAAVSFGAGWNVDDFLFFPERYARC
jgi:hypothetical protein